MSSNYLLCYILQCDSQCIDAIKITPLKVKCCGAGEQQQKQQEQQLSSNYCCCYFPAPQQVTPSMIIKCCGAGEQQWPEQQSSSSVTTNISKL